MNRLINAPISKTLLILAAVVLLAGIPTANVAAQDASARGIILSPPFLSSEIEGSSVIFEEFTVINQRAGKEQFTVYSKEVGISADGNFFIPEGFEDDITSRFEKQGWLTFSPRSFELERGETQKIQVELNLPSALPTNGYYLELAVKAGGPELDRGVGTVPEVAIPLLVNYVGIGQPVREMKINSFNHDNLYSHVIYEYLPVGFNTSLQNTGNMHVIPTGEIFISRDSDFRDIESSLAFNSSRNRVFGASSRSFRDVWDDALLVYQEDTLQLQVDEPFQMGRYYAQLSLTWDAEFGKQFATAVVDFWVIPWKLVTALTIAATVQLYLIRNYVVSRSRIKKLEKIPYSK